MPKFAGHGSQRARRAANTRDDAATCCVKPKSCRTRSSTGDRRANGSIERPWPGINGHCWTPPWPPGAGRATRIGILTSTTRWCELERGARGSTGDAASARRRVRPVAAGSRCRSGAVACWRVSPGRSEYRRGAGARARASPLFDRLPAARAVPAFPLRCSSGHSGAAAGT